MKIGDPSTDLKARTGEFTPPGKYVFDVSYKASDVLRFNVVAVDSMSIVLDNTKIQVYPDVTVRSLS